MRSGLETYLIEVIYKCKKIFMRRDRAVLIGAALSIAPFFPICILGLGLSIMNAIMIAIGRTRSDELPLVLASIVFGCVNIVIWIYLIAQLNSNLGWLLKICLHAISSFFLQIGLISDYSFQLDSFGV